MAQTTTIQVSTINRDALLELGKVMHQQSPAIWPEPPAFNTIVGYALARLVESEGLALFPPSSVTITASNA